MARADTPGMSRRLTRARIKHTSETVDQATVAQPVSSSSGKHARENKRRRVDNAAAQSPDQGAHQEILAAADELAAVVQQVQAVQGS